MPFSTPEARCKNLRQDVSDRGVTAVELAKLIVYYTTLGNISLKADVK